MPRYLCKTVQDLCFSLTSHSLAKEGEVEYRKASRALSLVVSLPDTSTPSAKCHPCDFMNFVKNLPEETPLLTQLGWKRRHRWESRDLGSEKSLSTLLWLSMSWNPRTSCEAYIIIGQSNWKTGLTMI